jgi:iron-sulfur cluster insertion protein
MGEAGSFVASAYAAKPPCAQAGRSSGLVLAAPAPYLPAMTDASDIALSPSAAARVAAIAAKQSKPAILRLSVEGGGCAGFQYRFGLAETAEADDIAVAQDGVTLVVDPVSLDLVRGSVVDFVESLGGAAFQVTNPNAASGCGCGTSFSI